MDSEKALAAIGALRQMLDLDYGYLPNPAVRKAAEKQISAIRENGPKSCRRKLPALAHWLDDLFLQKNDEGKRLPPQRVKDIQGYALGSLDRIEAEVKRGE